jgi:Flp pilus assembly pilin Flp
MGIAVHLDSPFFLFLRWSRFSGTRSMPESVVAKRDTMRVLETLPSRLGILLSGESAQDLVEYAMAVSLIALALISGMDKVATALVHSFANISTTLTPTPKRNYDYLGPGSLYGLPGLQPASPVYLSAAWEPAANPHRGMSNRHAAALGQSTEPFTAGD